MALSWTTDKLGPICRSAEDAALVFHAIQGPDGYDYSVKAYPFNWNAGLKPSELRIGYFKIGQGSEPFSRRDQSNEWVPNAEANNVLEVLESLGAKIAEVADPATGDGYLDSIILDAECGAAFQAPTLAGQLDVMERCRTPYPSTWPNAFRTAQFVPAVGYVNANRARTLLCKKMWDLFQKYDVIVTAQENTSVTNVVGTPSIVVPTGFALPTNQGRFGGGGRGAGGGGRGGLAACAEGTVPPATITPTHPPVPLPTSVAFLGPIFQDEKILAVAHAFQSVTDFHEKHPPQFA
jgi:Asp-tRNA(Asn)/Glu-tRNA(Gln) amidotransferase A subunit family amidase